MSGDPLPDLPPQPGEGEKKFGVYIHWPFCLSKCPYCDFNSHVRREPIDEPRFLRAFHKEITAVGARSRGRTVSTIFFGGGTPSLMQPATIAGVLNSIARQWRVADDAEIPLEATRPASKRSAFAAIARPASTGSRLACRRSTTARSPNLGGCTPRARRWTPLRWRVQCSSGSRSI